MNMKAWFMLVRPFTLIAPFMAILFGSTIQLAIYGDLNIFWDHAVTILFAALALAAAQAVGQIMNQVEDIDIDRVNAKSYRPLVSGSITPEGAQIVAWVSAIFSILVGFSIHTVYGFFIVTFILFGIFYNIEPFRLKKRLWVNTASLAVSRGLLPLPAAWSIFGNPADGIPWLLGCVMALWVLGWQNTKDIEDMEGDRAFGMITPAVFHGIERLAKIIAALSFLTFAALAVFLVTGALPPAMYALFLLALPTIWMTRKLFSMNFARSTLENNELWAGFYLTLAGFYLTAAAAYLVQPYVTLFG
jgi:4-hydroxybenzoate polyprenyltransferase